MGFSATIIITAYNNESTINCAIESAMTQYDCNAEIIVIDDCSTDNTCDILAQHNNITVIRNCSNIGPYQSRLIGLNKATSEYVTFLDGDDWLNKDAISLSLTAANEQKADIVQMTIKRRFSRFDLPLKYSSQYNANNAFNAVLFNERLFPVGCCGKLYRTQLLKNIKFPDIDLRWGEDRIFNIVVFATNSNIAITKNAVYNYRWGGNGTKATTNRIEDYTQTTLYKLNWASENNYSHYRQHILNEYIDISSYWVRQVLNTSVYTTKDIITALKKNFSILELDESICDDIYINNAHSTRRYISKLAQFTTKILS